MLTSTCRHLRTHLVADFGDLLLLCCRDAWCYLLKWTVLYASVLNHLVRTESLSVYFLLGVWSVHFVTLFATRKEWHRSSEHCNTVPSWLSSLIYEVQYCSIQKGNSRKTCTKVWSKALLHPLEVVPSPYQKLAWGGFKPFMTLQQCPFCPHYELFLLPQHSLTLTK